MTLRIDAHQHFWTLQRSDYGWLTPKLGPLYRDFNPQDLEPILRDFGIDKTIVVQAAPTVNETLYLLELAEQTDFIAGVVGWIDLQDGAHASRVLQELATSPKFIGVRPMIQDIDDPAWIARPELAPAVDALIEQNLCFDALVKPIHLPHLIQFLNCHPTLRVVVDHGAKPDIAGDRWQPWAQQMETIAKQPNVYCKLSGLMNEADPQGAGNDVLRYARHLLEVFGTQRLIWGSDWPVLNLVADYSDWHRITHQILYALDDAARARVLGGNAATFYGLKELQDDK